MAILVYFVSDDWRIQQWLIHVRHLAKSISQSLNICHSSFCIALWLLSVSVSCFNATMAIAGNGNAAVWTTFWAVDMTYFIRFV